MQKYMSTLTLGQGRLATLLDLHTVMLNAYGNLYIYMFGNNKYYTRKEYSMSTNSDTLASVLCMVL